MTTVQVVETSVTVNNNSPIQNYVHPDDHTQPTFAFFLFVCLFVFFLILIQPPWDFYTLLEICATAPSPKPTLTLTSHLGHNVGLGEG